MDVRAKSGRIACDRFIMRTPLALWVLTSNHYREAGGWSKPAKAGRFNELCDKAEPKPRLSQWRDASSDQEARSDDTTSL